MAVSVNDFGKAVVAAGLMSADEVKLLWDGLAPEARPKNAEAFGKLLETRGKLTAYQAASSAGNGVSLVLGDYVVLAKIGAGGMGQVFKAQHRRMKRLVAIKLLPPAMTKDEAAVKRFQREVEAAAKLSHPNIVTAHDAGFARGAHYLVMEYVEGKDLSHLVKSNGPLPVADAVNYITQAARGLAYAHSEGVVHRDIKPANLLLDKKGVVKILDMGLARFDDSNVAMDAAEEGLTQSGQVMGTVDYMAPEQAFDTRHADARADIYSLGCSLYRLLIGENVYSGDTVMQKFLAHREKPIPSLREKRPEVTEALDAIFQKMMAKLPEDRYQPTSQLVADLEACASPAGSASNLAPSQSLSTFVAKDSSGLLLGTAAEDGMTAALGNQLLRSLPDSRTAPREETFGSSAFDRTQRGRKGLKTTISGGNKPPWQNPLVLSAAGAGAVLLVLLGVWVIVRDKGGKPVAKVQVPEGGSVEVKPAQEIKQKPTKQDEIKAANDSSPFKVGSASKGSATKTPQPVAPSPSGQAVDVLALIDPVKQAATGQWQLEKGVLLSSAGNEQAAIELPVAVATSYRLEADVERQATNGSFRVGLKVGAASCQAVLDADSHSGLSRVRNQRAFVETNPTRTDGPIFTKGQACRIVIDVTPTSVRVECDGRAAINWKGDAGELSDDPSSPGVPNKLWLGTSSRVFKVSKLTYTPMSSGQSIPAEALTFNGHRYLLVGSLGTWDEAKAKAETMGGHLVTINSNEERDWVFQNVWLNRPKNVGPGGKSRIFLGGTRAKGKESFEWVTGEPFDMTLWLGKGPNDKGVVGLTWSENTNWDDVTADYIHPFILVEWDTLGPQ